MSDLERNGLKEATYQALKSDPDMSETIAELEDKIADLEAEIEDLKASVTVAEQDRDEIKEKHQLLLDAMNEVEDIAKRTQKAYSL